MLSAGKPATLVPWANRAHRAMAAPVTTPMVGAKFEMVLRTRLVKKTPRRSFLSVVAKKNVVEAVTAVKRAFVRLDVKNVLPTSETASTTNMVEINVLKISSVNLVRYFTKFDALVMELKNKMAAVQMPVQE